MAANMADVATNFQFQLLALFHCSNQVLFYENLPAENKITIYLNFKNEA